MTLRDLRRSKKLTQEECARYLGIPLRTYQNYETDHAKAGTMKYEFMVQKLKDFGFL
ncbi:MAG: helix-turn-helix transcriptional regulator, partial [Clostridia bacterium]|nr:helix-turn-helix transcriptional regulator [Clostridia bacterium]